MRVPVAADSNLRETASEKGGKATKKAQMPRITGHPRNICESKFSRVLSPPANALVSIETSAMIQIHNPASASQPGVC